MVVWDFFHQQYHSSHSTKSRGNSDLLHLCFQIFHGGGFLAKTTSSFPHGWILTLSYYIIYIYKTPSQVTSFSTAVKVPKNIKHTWNPKWLFQLDDSQSLHRKWLFLQTSIYKWLFGVPGISHSGLIPNQNLVQWKVS